MSKPTQRPLYILWENQSLITHIFRTHEVVIHSAFYTITSKIIYSKIYLYFPHSFVTSDLRWLHKFQALPQKFHWILHEKTKLWWHTFLVHMTLWARVHVTNGFELHNQYYYILPPETQDFKTQSWKQAPKDTDESEASWGCIIILYQKYTAVFWLRGIVSKKSNVFELCNQKKCILHSHFQIFRCNHKKRPQRTLMSL